jgi:hypothetical protein
MTDKVLPYLADVSLVLNVSGMECSISCDALKDRRPRAFTLKSIKAEVGEVTVIEVESFVEKDGHPVIGEDGNVVRVIDRIIPSTLKINGHDVIGEASPSPRQTILK